MAMAMVMVVLEILGPIEEKGRGVTQERQTMLLLRRGLAGEPLSPVSWVGEIAPHVAFTACGCSSIYLWSKNVALLQFWTYKNIALLQFRTDECWVSTDGTARRATYHGARSVGLLQAFPYIILTRILYLSLSSISLYNP
jgi:hypothetical protein